MTINDVYSAVKFFANKEQRGFVKPSEFNTLAKQAQMELINEKLDKIRKYKSAEKTGTNYRGSTEDPKDFLAELGRLSKSVNLAYDSSLDAFSYPVDMLHLQFLTHITTTNSIDSLNTIQIVEDDNINYILRSNLSAPSTLYPVAVRTSKGFEVFPTTIQANVKAKYYKEPSSPRWGYQASGTDYIYNSNLSTQFELPESCHNDIIIKILKYIGVSLRDAELSSYAVQTEINDYTKTR